MLTSKIARSMQTNLLKRLTVRCHPQNTSFFSRIPQQQYRQFSSDNELDELFGETKADANEFKIFEKKPEDPFDATIFIKKNNIINENQLAQLIINRYQELKLKEKTLKEENQQDLA